MSSDSLAKKRCLPCEGGVAKLNLDEIHKHLKNLPEWQLADDHKSIWRDFKFKNYYQTMAFVNAIARMAHLEDHHPDLSVHYNHCLVRYNTHALAGLSDNDFICAAKVDALLNA